jgi:hypothetical protein
MVYTQIREGGFMSFYYKCKYDPDHLKKLTIAINISKPVKNNPAKQIVFNNEYYVCYVWPWKAKEYLAIVRKLGLHCVIRWYGCKLVIGDNPKWDKID